MKIKNAVIIVLIIAIIVVVLTGCGKSQEAKNVEAAISMIGEVDLNSSKAITDAEELYYSLSEKDAKSVENYAVLTAAREKYNALVYEEAVGNIQRFDYDKAIQLLESIPSYKDAQSKLEEAEEGLFQSQCANYIFNFIKDGGFFNPSAVRILDAVYRDETDYYAKMLKADGVIYLKAQGTNRLGGTLNKEYAIFVGGDKDGEAYGNDDSNIDYKVSDKVIDVPTINKMLQKYWEEYGL